MLWYLLLIFGCATQTPWPTEPAPNRCEAGGLPQEEAKLMLESGGKTRFGLVWAPDGAGPHDLVVNLHEFRAEPRRQQHYTGWVEFAPELNALLVGPDGKTATWNAGTCCGKARQRGHDDVSFLDDVVTRMDQTGCTSGRVLATGIGNGAMMAHRWACESDVVDGVIAVGGGLQVDACPQERPIPVYIVYGAKDTYFPMDGSTKGLMSIEHTLEAYKKRNRITGPSVVSEDGDLRCEEWQGAAPLRFCVAKPMEDRWPGAEGAKLTSNLPDVDATRGAWAWMVKAWSQEAP